MGILSKIFGTDEAIKGGIDIIKSAGDALWYTDEEKAQDKANRAQQIDTLLVNWMDTTKGQNIARRLLAVLITSVWLSLYVVGIILNLVSVWVNDELRINMIVNANLLSDNADKMSGAVMLILAFYFAAPHMSKIVDGALSKFAGKVTK